MSIFKAAKRRGVEIGIGESVEDIIREAHFDNRLIKVYQNRPKNLLSVLDHTVFRFPDKEAIVCNNQRLTYEQFRKQVNDAAFVLSTEYGISRGDRVALLLGNNIEFCISIFAVSQLGAITVPLNNRLKSSELEFMLNHSGSRALIVEKQYWQNITQIKKKLLTVKDVFFVGDEAPDGASDFKALLAAPAGKTISVDAGEEDIAFIMFTSGTTGTPKGAMGTHMGMIHSAINYVQVFQTTPEDRTLLVVPLFHVTGLIGQLIHMIYVGGTVVLMREYKTELMIEFMSRENITFTFVVPTIYVLMLMNPNLDKCNLNSYRIAAYGGAPMSLDTIRKLSERFPKLKLHNAYGATETSSPATLLPSKDALNKASSVGLPVPVGDLKVVDENGNTLPPNEVGELWVKGPMVVPGYWENPEANAREFTDGFWHSGDLARIEKEGYVYIMDRKKDMINRGGEKIFCLEVEDVLYSHPKVLEAAVVGVPDEIFGEQVKAVVIPKPGQSLSEDEIRQWLAERLADYKVPKYVEFSDQLPRNPGGKVLKALLK